MDLHNAQSKVAGWLTAVAQSGHDLSIRARTHRMLEEALEYAQASGCAEADAMQLIRYVYSRPIGAPRVEAGDALWTLLGLINAQGYDANTIFQETDKRAWDRIESIKQKMASADAWSPLPGKAPTE